MSSLEDVDFDTLFLLSSYGTDATQAIQAVMPTPPHSPPDGLISNTRTGRATEDADNVTISVSTRFFPGANLSTEPEDLTLRSVDSVFFRVASSLILQHTNNRFRSLIPAILEKDQIVYVLEESQVLNIILNTLYNLSVADHSPPFPTLISAINTFPIYGLDPKVFIQQSKPLFTFLSSHAPLYPIEVYCLAASFDLYDLAVATSSHLLSFQLSNLSDAIAARIGPVYLNRLVGLHLYRIEQLKALLLPSPQTHPETPSCSFEDQRRLNRAWTLAAAYLAWDARPDLSGETIQFALGSLANDLSCPDCKRNLAERVNDAIVKWSLLRRTI